MIGPVALALLSALSHPFAGLSPHPRGDVQASHYRLEGWRLDVRKDQFSGLTSCKLQRGDVLLERGVAVFQFRRSVDTANALFRLDEGQPQTAGSVAVEAAGLGAQLRTGNLKNPSDGRVTIPYRVIGGARLVSIRPNPRTSHRDFNLVGLPAAVGAAQAQGCDITPTPA